MILNCQKIEVIMILENFCSLTELLAILKVTEKL